MITDRIDPYSEVISEHIDGDADAAARAREEDTHARVAHYKNRRFALGTSPNMPQARKRKLGLLRRVGQGYPSRGELEGEFDDEASIAEGALSLTNRNSQRIAKRQREGGNHDEQGNDRDGGRGDNRNSNGDNHRFLAVAFGPPAPPVEAGLEAFLAPLREEHLASNPTPEAFRASFLRAALQLRTALAANPTWNPRAAVQQLIAQALDVLGDVDSSDRNGLEEVVQAMSNLPSESSKPRSTESSASTRTFNLLMALMALNLDRPRSKKQRAVSHARSQIVGL